MFGRIVDLNIVRCDLNDSIQTSVRIEKLKQVY